MSAVANEHSHVELPLLAQLQGLGWTYLAGDTDVPELTERTNFREVLLTGRVRAALRRLNLDDQGQPWLDAAALTRALGTLERLGTAKLMEANERATALLLQGTTVPAESAGAHSREQQVHFIDFDHPERNDFLVINQFRVDVPGGKHYIVPDVVLFVNGIPLVVIECKSPAATDPMQAGITQLLRYSNQRDPQGPPEGPERLFHYNQVLISTFFYQARAATVGADATQYLEWKDTRPVPQAAVAAALGVEQLTSQQTLVAGMLRPAHLLDLMRHFILFHTADGKRIKVLARYQQFRAVHAALHRLRTGPQRTATALDGRGGIIWHTQGSGKSLTMVFLVRALRTTPDLRRFKVVVVTDRTDLEKQLRATAALTGETPRRVQDSAKLQEVLREPGPDLVFAMIQKYQERDDDAPPALLPTTPRKQVAEPPAVYTPPAPDLFPELNTSPDILVLVDEAHRSQASTLHANLQRALPNCARIGFTGTPILMGERKYTQEIFGPFLDRYTLQQSEADGATVPIFYEGRTAEAAVADGRSLDSLFEDMFRERSAGELEAIKKKYATLGNILEAPNLIAAKAADMLRHYISTVLPNGFKAQVVASSRLAAVRYQHAFVAAHQALVAQLDALDPALTARDPATLAAQDAETQFLVAAHQHLPVIRRLEFAAVISGNRNDPTDWQPWIDSARHDTHIERFKKPLVHADPTRQDGLAVLCVRTMLLTGFDAAVEQVMYLDRGIQGHELLQAIARVNRTRPGKSCGLVVDYFGVGRHLKDALAAYSAEDVQGVLPSLRDELPTLEARYRRVLAVFADAGIPSIADTDACVYLLAAPRVRAEFIVKLKDFLTSLDRVLPRPEALPYVAPAHQLGFINKSAANLYRDDGLNLVGVGGKVRELIDAHMIARGIDPQVPPISILDADFERRVAAQTSDRAKASEMEHAARYHISAHYQEDPAYYKKLSQRLEELLAHYREDWAALVAALQDLTQGIQHHPPADPPTRLLNLLAEEISPDAPLPDPQRAALAAAIPALVAHIGREIRIVDFWRNLDAQQRLRGWVVQYLDDRDLVPFKRLEAVADRVLELAKALHTRLTGE